MKYTPHGNIELKWVGNILLAYPSGEINLEGAKRFHQLADKEIRGKGFETFARIIEYTDINCLATQEAYQEFQLHIADNLSKGCKYIAIIGANSVSHHYLENILCESKCPHDFFYTPAIAMEYLSSSIKGIYLNC